MCKFCENNFKIKTTIGDKELHIYLDEDINKKLNIRLPFPLGGGITRPIFINYCPFCGEDLQELSCESCINYNIGDGIDDISYCKGCENREV